MNNKLKLIIQPKILIIRILFKIAKFLIWPVNKIVKFLNNHISLNEKINFLNTTVNNIGLKKNVILLKKNLDQEKLSFEHHDLMIRKIYGDAPKLVEKNISQSLCKKLLELKDDLGEISAKKSYQDEIMINSDSGKELNPDFIISKIRPETVEEENKHIIIHPMYRMTNSNIILNELHSELREIFSSHIKSPFKIVNTRLWTTKPSSKRFGGNKMHYDHGFEPGHMKIMIYLTPFNNDYGYFQYENTTINNKPEGFSILFQNADILHSGVPGNKYNRVAAEVTIMRTLVDGKQSNLCSYWGRHLKSPLAGYRKGSLY